MLEPSPYFPNGIIKQNIFSFKKVFPETEGRETLFLLQCLEDLRIPIAYIKTFQGPPHGIQLGLDL